VLFCFLAGLFARTLFAQKITSDLEAAVLSKVPAYDYLKQTGSSIMGLGEMAEHSGCVRRLTRDIIAGLVLATMAAWAERSFAAEQTLLMHCILRSRDCVGRREFSAPLFFHRPPSCRHSMSRASAARAYDRKSLATSPLGNQGILLQRLPPSVSERRAGRIGLGQHIKNLAFGGTP
jgi:hypothetical protein